ncbi:hypothetical protein WMZ97_11915 [Lentibacillus sp. N15]|uniref:hypothetical protein n=1 Tax=Lentibacillus songyuanensis TaxID=3136161 RepID=UPI0031B9B84A
MKKMFFIWISMILLLIMTGCSNDDEAAKELIDYYNNDWITVQKMKEENLNPKKDKLIDIENDSKNKASTYVKEELMPSMKEILDYLNHIELEHKEVKKLHRLEMEGEEFAYKGFKDGIAYYKGELTDDEMNENTKKLEKKYDAFLERRDKLMDKYNIVWVDDSSSESGYQKMKLKR